MSEEKLYVVTERDLKAFYDAMGRVADALIECAKNDPLIDTQQFEDVWDDNVGGTFEYMFEGQKLRSQDYERLEMAWDYVNKEHENYEIIDTTLNHDCPNCKNTIHFSASGVDFEFYLSKLEVYLQGECYDCGWLGVVEFHAKDKPISIRQHIGLVKTDEAIE
ncbi:MAG: hypothetical protein CXT67_00255 [Methanobacteriota archaeon]|nr:MAG: hypothetical protein CXT67_00255 [Euryarchaeota archaeon]